MIVLKGENIMNKFVYVPLVLALGACSSGMTGKSKVEMNNTTAITPIYSNNQGEVKADVKDAIATEGKGVYKIGNPYQINGVWYYPKENYNYVAEGVASWYGPDFHNGITANGELYDMHGLTAAHPTLPLPTIARVTNKANGRSLIVRINDRGPFVNDRAIDVSKRAAQLLGFLEQGTTEVKIEVLEAESKALKNELLQKGDVSKLGMVEGQNSVVVEEIAPVAAPAPVAFKKPAYEVNKPTPITLKPDVLPEGIYIQVGAYSKFNNAEIVKTKLDGIAPIHVYEIYSNNKSFYRVRLGPFTNYGSANTALDKVKAKKYKDARIVEEKKPLKTSIGQRFNESM